MDTSLFTQRLLRYAVLMRWHKPIGILLLLWPTLWALWLANEGPPHISLLLIFCAGVIVMRSAGCVINDIADRRIDSHVARTQQRPLACHVITLREAWLLFLGLLSIGFTLLLQLNSLAIISGIIALGFIIFYPFSKRYTHFPQVVLGLTFYASIPIAFAASLGFFTPLTWITYGTAALWAVIYDTFYAMTDREDDQHVGVKSTAIFFGQYDRLIIGILQCIFIGLLFYIGRYARLGFAYQISVILSAACCVYHQYLIRRRNPQACFSAFLHNHWIGLIIFAGLFLHYLIVNQAVDVVINL